MLNVCTRGVLFLLFIDVGRVPAHLSMLRVHISKRNLEVEHQKYVTDVTKRNLTANQELKLRFLWRLQETQARRGVPVNQSALLSQN